MKKSLLEVYELYEGPPYSSTGSDFIQSLEKKVRESNNDWVSVYEITMSHGYESSDFDIYFYMCERLESLNIVKTKTLLTNDEFRLNKIQNSDVEGIYSRHDSKDNNGYPIDVFSKLDITDEYFIELMVKLSDEAYRLVNGDESSKSISNEDNDAKMNQEKVNIASPFNKGSVWFYDNSIYTIEGKSSRQKSRTANRIASMFKTDDGEILFKLESNVKQEDLTEYNLKKYGRYLDWLSDSHIVDILSDKFPLDSKRLEVFKIIAYVACVQKSLEEYVEEYDKICSKKHTIQESKDTNIEEKVNYVRHHDKSLEQEESYQYATTNVLVNEESSQNFIDDDTNDKDDDKKDKGTDESNLYSEDVNQYISEINYNTSSKKGYEKFKPIVWGIGALFVILTVGYSYYQKILIEDSTSSIEKELNSPTSEWRLVKRAEMETLISELEKLKTQNSHLVAERDSVIKYEVDKYKSEVDGKISEIEMNAYEKGKKEAFNLEDGDFEKVSKLKLEDVVVSGECEAFNDRKIGKIYPVNMPMKVVRWIVDPKSLSIAGVIGTSEEIRKSYDQRVSTVRCLVGKSDVWASNGTPFKGKDGRSLPKDEKGNPIETNPVYKEVEQSSN